MIVGLLKLNYGVLLQSIVVFEYCPVNGKKTELDLISATMDSIVDAYKELKEKYQNQLYICILNDKEMEEEISSKLNINKFNLEVKEIIEK